jgi:hypothetical protein
MVRLLPVMPSFPLVFLLVLLALAKSQSWYFLRSRAMDQQLLMRMAKFVQSCKQITLQND